MIEPSSFDTTKSLALTDEPRAGRGADHFRLPEVVAALRRARGIRRDTAGLGRPARPLPSRDAVDEVVKGLRKVLFPTHFGSPDLTDAGVDYFVGHTLDETLHLLRQQTRNTLLYEAREPCDDLAEVERRASRLVAAFAARLPAVRALLESDIRAAHEGDPAAKSRAEIMYCYPGLTAIMHHRLAHELYALGLTLLARVVAERAHSTTGIDIHPGARIGERFFIDHGTGVVIGETAVIGRNVRIYQGVTLGAVVPREPRLVGASTKERHPIVEDDVILYAGATVLGRVTIGRGATIGGNVWLTKGVPPHSRVTQAQLHSETYDGGAGI